MNTNKLSKKEKSWILYDVANSAFILTVMTILFPILQKSIAAADGYTEDTASRVFMYVTSAIALLVALLSPLLGAAANYKGNKKKFFKMFMIIGIVGGLGLCIPGLSWITLMAIFVISSIGYNGANVFYDAFLVDVADDESMDKISSLGYAWGYIGSLIPFTVGIIPYALCMFEILPGEKIINFTSFWSASVEHLTISFAFIVSIAWWAILSIPILKNVEQTFELEPENGIIADSFGRLADTIKDISKYKNIALFLVAYLLYIDVVNSVIRLATTIGTDLGVTPVDMLIVVVIVQVVAFPCAIIFGTLTKKFGAKNMIYYGIAVYTVAIILVSRIYKDTTYFMFIVGFIVGTAQGGIQAVSRSYFAKMVPEDKHNEFFGFFSVFGKFAGIFSPFLLATLYPIVGKHNAVLFLLVPLGISVILLLFVKNTTAKDLKEQSVNA